MGDHGTIGGCWPLLDLMRSEPMHLVQVIVPIESAHPTVSYLDDLGLFQFKDTGEFFYSAQTSATAQQREIEAQQSDDDSLDSPLLLDQEMLIDPSNQLKLVFVCGLVPKEKSMAFERILFRATRGNMFLKHAAIADPVTDPVSGEMIQDALQRATFDSNSHVGSIFQVLPAKEYPPTYFRTNKFTSAFQEIVDAYGVAKYQEANPTVYTIITFPFLFAVMFGDWDHGLCLLVATLFLIIRERNFLFRMTN